MEGERANADYANNCIARHLLGPELFSAAKQDAK